MISSFVLSVSNFIIVAPKALRYRRPVVPLLNLAGDQHEFKGNAELHFRKQIFTCPIQCLWSTRCQSIVKTPKRLVVHAHFEDRVYLGCTINNAYSEEIQPTWPHHIMLTSASAISSSISSSDFVTSSIIFRVALSGRPTTLSKVPSILSTKMEPMPWMP